MQLYGRVTTIPKLTIPKTKRDRIKIPGVLEPKTLTGFWF
jgi:hypothetical protein